jgi:hypothetical protein
MVSGYCLPVFLFPLYLSLLRPCLSTFTWSSYCPCSFHCNCNNLFWHYLVLRSLTWPYTLSQRNFTNFITNIQINAIYYYNLNCLNV